MSGSLEPWSPPDGTKECVGWRRRRRDENKRWAAGYKVHVGCARCGERDHRCLDYHHRDPSTKTLAISMIVDRAPLVVLIQEIGKCDVLCANCHRKEHGTTLEPKAMTSHDLEMAAYARSVA